MRRQRDARPRGWRALMAALIMGAILVPLGGCWDRRELNELNIVTGLGVDWKDGQYVVTAEIVNPRAVNIPGQGGSGSAQQPASAIIRGAGPTFVEALSDLQHHSTRTVFLPTASILVIGSELAQSGFDPILEVFSREERLRLNVRVFVSQGEASTLFAAQPAGISQTFSLAVFDGIRFGRFAGSFAYAPRLYRMLTWEAEPQRAVLAGGIIRTPSVPKGAPGFTLDQAAILDDGRLVAWVPRQDVPSALVLLDRFVHGDITVACPGPAAAPPEEGMPGPDRTIDGKSGPAGKSATLRFRSLEAQTHARLDPHGPQIDLRIVGEGVAIADPCAASVSLTQLQAAVDRKIAADIRRTVAAAQAHRADYFGWGYDLYRNNPRLWVAGYARDWPATFANLAFGLRVEVRVTRFALANLGPAPGLEP